MRLASTSGLVALLVVLASVPQATATPSTTIVISEFRVRGPNGGKDEFIELYNLSASPVNIGTWKVDGSDGGGNVAHRASIPAGTILQPGCHYLLAHFDGYSGTVARDLAYTLEIKDDGGIRVTAPSVGTIDQVGLSTGSLFQEGTVLAPLLTNVNRSYERKPGGLAGSGQDTDDNASDFQLIQPSDPQNLASTCITIPTATESESWGAVKGLFR